MRPTEIHCYLVYPHNEHAPEQEIRRTSISKIGQTWNFLSEVFEKAESECDLQIDFVSEDQTNQTRSAVIRFFTGPTLDNGVPIAALLQRATPRTAGIGLLFCMYGSSRNKHRLVISRFPADSGLVAEEEGEGLNVDFIEKLFLKDRRHYKCVQYGVESGLADEIGEEELLTFRTTPQGLLPTIGLTSF